MRARANILVLGFTNIGDAVLSTCVVEPLRAHSPEARLTFLAGERAAPILDGEPGIGTVYRYSPSVHRGVRGRWLLVRELRARRFDLVVDLRDAPYSRLLGARRIGLREYGRVHAVDRYLGALRAAGITTDQARPALTPTALECDASRAWLRQSGIRSDRPTVGIHPGGNWAYKLWLPDRFAAVADGLSADFEAQTLVFAGPGEKAMASECAEACRHPATAVGDVSLRMLAALIQACDLYVGNDTGPMHIADAVGTRVVALFEPTDDVRSGPYGREHSVIRSDMDLGCNPCHPGKTPGGCGKGFCEPLHSITSDRVLVEARRQLADILTRKGSRGL
ncbi:glycosyltransferase family 9 protein [Candidatus Poribacteria bacterium]|nr:glycosyltransferase family 9 protein [Candidatus Poribacteria bacterium]